MSACDPCESPHDIRAGTEGLAPMARLEASRKNLLTLHT
jgi:hypothetical protein